MQKRRNKIRVYENNKAVLRDKKLSPSEYEKAAIAAAKKAGV